MLDASAGLRTKIAARVRCEKSVTELFSCWWVVAIKSEIGQADIDWLIRTGGVLSLVDQGRIRLGQWAKQLTSQLRCQASRGIKLVYIVLWYLNRTF